MPEARTGIGRYFDFYNAPMPHSRRGRRTPDQLDFKPPLFAAA